MQNVGLDVWLEDNAQATFWSHCLFMFPDQARHAMDARIELGPGARLAYNEVHYHGLSGGIEVVPRAKVKVGERAHYRADFSLVQGLVGKLDIDYDVEVGADATAELTSLDDVRKVVVAFKEQTPIYLGDLAEGTVVVTMSEFGRTARENGDRGTDRVRTHRHLDAAAHRFTFGHSHPIPCRRRSKSEAGSENSPGSVCHRITAIDLPPFS